MIETGPEKVIFLDVDGVLNKNTDGSLIEDEFVERLAKIVKAAKADIILSSSWRYSYAKHIENNLYSCKYSELLISMLKKHGLQIAGTTPLTHGSWGVHTRPFEVRTWLSNRDTIRRFVILDDDFWIWNWLEDFVVCTTHEEKSADPYPHGKKYTYGLTDSDAEKAIEILNRPITPPELTFPE